MTYFTMGSSMQSFHHFFPKIPLIYYNRLYKLYEQHATVNKDTTYNAFKKSLDYLAEQSEKS